jgi:protein-disulfide isomerase
MKKILIFFILFILTIQSIYAWTNYKPNQKDLKIISSINSKIDKIVQKKWSDSSLKLLDKLSEIENKIQSDERLSYIMKELIQNLTLQITLYEVSNHEDLTKKLSWLEIKVYDDIRCKTCNTENIIDRLKTIPLLNNSNYDKKDFSDQEVVDYLKDNHIKNLPLIIFPTNKVDQSIDNFLKPIGNGEYYLEINANFDPYAKRSDRGILQIELSELEKIKNYSYIKGKLNAKILWLEYSDLECPFCARLHNSTTWKDLTKKYWDDLSIIFNHFPLSFHPNAQNASEALECIGSSNWGDAFYKVIEESYKKYDNNNFDLNWLYNIAESEWVNKEALIKCVDSWIYTDKVNNQMDIGQNTFWVTGTPGNVLINTITWEYIVISWAYPTASFEKIIDKLLSK